MVVRICSFEEAEGAITRIRNEVFVQGQGVSTEDEFDGTDGPCTHVIVEDSDGPVATGRVAADGRIGRVAVLKRARGTGVGRIVMDALEQHASKAGTSTVYATAQVQALGFYEKLGYEVRGDEFMQCDIPHVRIQKTLPTNSTT